MGSPILSLLLLFIACHVFSRGTHGAATARLEERTLDRAATPPSMQGHVTTYGTQVSSSGTQHGSTKQNNGQSKFRNDKSTNRHLISVLTQSNSRQNSYLQTATSSYLQTTTNSYLQTTTNSYLQTTNSYLQTTINSYLQTTTRATAPSDMYWTHRWTTSPMLSSNLSHLSFFPANIRGERYDILKHGTDTRTPNNTHGTDARRDQRYVVLESTPNNTHGTDTRRDQRSVVLESTPNNTHDNNMENVFDKFSSLRLSFLNLSLPTITEDSSQQIQVGLNEEVNIVTTSNKLVDNNDTRHAEKPRNTLYIGGLFELSGKYVENGYSELDAALLAVSHINQQGFLPGYRLQLLYNDSKCDPGVATDAFFDFIYRKSRDTSLIMVMGSACTEVTKTIAEIVPYWNLIMISYAATSPALSEREKYRTFFRLALGDSALNPARRMLIRHFRWDKVAALYEDLESMSLAFNGISKDFSAHGIVIKFSTSFKDPGTELRIQLKDIKDLDVRIIIVGVTETAARQVFCEAYKQGMYGSRYVWVLVGGHNRQWWKEAREDDARCSQNELGAAVEGAFTVVDFNGLLDGRTSVGSSASKDFLEAYFRANGSQPMSSYATCSYDTVWTIANTIRHALEQWEKNGTAPLLHQLRYEDMVSVKETFINTMENLEFLGVSGPVSFKGSDREGIAVVYQIQGGNLTQVAVHQPSSTNLDFDCSACSQVIWQGGKVPNDEQVIVPRLKTIETYVFYSSTCLCVGGVILAAFFLTYNLYHGRLKFIKLSSPKLNNVAVIGCMLVYLTVVLMGLDDGILAEDAFPVVCSGRAFLLAAGFSLAFGAMFAKTFRVHQIFTRTHHGLVKSKLIQDTHLLVIIGVLLAVDSVLIFAWVVVDPMGRQVTNITRQVSAHDEDLIYQEQLATCHSVHLQKWLAAFYAYKGLLLIFGVYMAWETRHVKIPALNDSRYIGLNVYNVVIMSVSVVVISNILSSQPTLVYAMEAAFMLLSTTVTLCLLFLPKIYVIVTSGGNPVIASLGIVVDNTNTRRFVFDDTRELYYRAEVQNRVYKRELIELDQQIARLERLLEIPLHPYPMLTEELLYLLPESSVDCTPQCHRRYKTQLDRCNSISDGGECVTFDLAENDDILMEMTFGSMSQTPLPYKRHSSVETPKISNSPLERLTRSLSIGGSSVRGRKRKKGRAQLKSPIPFCSSETNFINNSNHAHVEGTNQLLVSRRKPNRLSYDMSYLHSKNSADLSTSYLDVNNRCMISRHDKITQTGNESPMKKGHVVTGQVDSSKASCADDPSKVRRKMGNNIIIPDNDKCSFYDPPTSVHSHPFHFKDRKMFAVQKIQIQSLDDDITSHIDNDYMQQTRLEHQNHKGQSVSNLHTDMIYDMFGVKHYNIVNYSSTPVLTEAAQEEEPSWYAKNTRLVIPKICESKESLNLSVCRSPDCQWMLNIDSSGRPRSASTPNPPTSTPLSQSSESPSHSEMSPSSQTTNISNPPQYPLCLSHHSVPCHIMLQTPSDHCSHCCVNSETCQSQYAAPSPDTWHVLHSNTLPSKESSSGTSHIIPLISLPQTTSSSKPHHATGNTQPSSPTQYRCSASSSSSPRPDFLSILESSLTPLQIFPFDREHTDISLANSPSANSAVSPQSSLPPSKFRPARRKQSSACPQDSNYPNVNNVKTSLKAERRKKIQKLQDDLVRIQKELQDLKDLEYDISEV